MNTGRVRDLMAVAPVQVGAEQSVNEVAALSPGPYVGIDHPVETGSFRKPAFRDRGSGPHARVASGILAA